MESYEVLKKLNYIGNETANVKIVVDDEEYNRVYDIKDITWTGYKDGGEIIIKLDNRFIGQELIDKITKMVDEYPKVDDNIKNNLVLEQVLKREDWNRQQKTDFIIEYFKNKIYGIKED